MNNVMSLRQYFLYWYEDKVFILMASKGMCFKTPIEQVKSPAYIVQIAGVGTPAIQYLCQIQSMKTLFSILGLTALLSCSSASEKETESTTSYQNSEIHLPVTAEEDTLRLPYHQFYLADLNQREISRLILNDSLQLSDNHVTFALMDSLKSPNKATRDAVFPPFKVVVEKSDGALSEVVGLYAMKYVEAYPKEFAERYLCCLEELTQLTNYIGYEIMVSEEPTSEYKQLFEKINQKFPKYEQDKSIRAFKEKLEAYMQEFEG